jgi:hypothetical protein
MESCGYVRQGRQSRDARTASIIIGQISAGHSINELFAGYLYFGPSKIWTPTYAIQFGSLFWRVTA